MKRTTAVIAALTTLLLVSGCGGDDTDGSGTDPDTTESQSDASDEPTEDASADEPDAPAGGTTLIATVGEEDDPDAFTITLTDESGNDVTELPAGDYVVEVIDYSEMHNFHLTGGSVDETTTVDEVTEVTWEVTLEAGEYTFICDPHPQNMVGTFTVA